MECVRLMKKLFDCSIKYSRLISNPLDGRNELVRLKKPIVVQYVLKGTEYAYFCKIQIPQ